MNVNSITGVRRDRQYIITNKKEEKTESESLSEAREIEYEVESKIEDIKNIKRKTDEIVTRNLMKAYSTSGKIKRLVKIRNEILAVQGANSEREAVINRMIATLTNSYNESMQIVKELTDEYKSNFSDADLLKLHKEAEEYINELQDANTENINEISFKDIKSENEIFIKNDSFIGDVKDISFKDIR